MTLKNIKLVLFFFFIGAFAQAQNIIVDPAPTPADLVTNTLIGPGLTTSNITFTGSDSQIGYFEANGSNIGLDSGVVMSSGNVIGAIPGGNVSTNLSGAGDADVLATAQSVTDNPQAGDIDTTFDAAVLEFDFVPNGDVVIFNFVFASEEYLQYINTQYNDAFGFYISGPNPAGGNYTGDNLALVPGTTQPITISTIYVDPTETPTERNGQYFLGNPDGHEYNGFTIPIQIRFNVLCDSTYHFKFAVADCMDGILDTGVLLEGGSFQALPVDLELQTNAADSVIFEGCGTDVDFIFSRPSCQSSDSLWVEVDYSGTATNGPDYTLPDSVLFLPGSTTVVVPFTANQDGIQEGPESVTLSITNILPSGDTVVVSGTIWLNDNADISVTAQDTTIVCQYDSVPVYAVGAGGVPPYVYSWSQHPSVVDSAYAGANVNGTFDYYVTITDTCGFTDTDTLTMVVAYPVAEFAYTPETGCSPLEVNITNNSLNSTNFYWDWGDGTNASVNDLSAQTHTYTQTSTIILVAYSSDPSCPDTTLGLVQVDVCGCTSPTATNYDPAATLDDGSCEFPFPEVVAPNVFTPNGDGQNDIFDLDITNAIHVEFIILNRWGNIVYEQNFDPTLGMVVGWDGKTPSGGDAQEGTYFYRYVAKGVNEYEIDGHGFVQLVRD